MQKDFIILKNKTSFRVIYCGFLSNFWSSEFISRGRQNKLSDATGVEWSIKPLNFHFFFYI